MARIPVDSGGADEARALLQPIYERFQEGHATADIENAKSLLASLDGAG